MNIQNKLGHDFGKLEKRIQQIEEILRELDGFSELDTEKDIKETAAYMLLEQEKELLTNKQFYIEKLSMQLKKSRGN